MSTIGARREWTDRLLASLAAEPGDRPVAGDFAAVCTDLHADTWELFPVHSALQSGEIVTLEGQLGELLAFGSISERNQAVTAPARDFPDFTRARQLCWIPFNGLAGLRVQIAKLKGTDR